MTARVLAVVQVVCVLAVVCSGEGDVILAVNYPVSGNYNRVTLTCNDDFGARLNDAEFIKRIPGQGSRSAGPPTNGEITITLTQEEEGYFSCRNADIPSEEIGLAGKLY